MKYFTPLETLKYSKRPLYYIDTPCKTWRDFTDDITNPKFRNFNQIIYHAGDRPDFWRYGLLWAMILHKKSSSESNESSESNKTKKSNYVLPPQINTTYYTSSLQATVNTFNYMWCKFKKGVYVAIRNNQLVAYLPFSNARYRSTWYRFLHLNHKDRIILKKLYQIELRLLKNTHRNYGFTTMIDLWKKHNHLELVTERLFRKAMGHKYHSNRRMWYANNCFFRNDPKLEEGDKQTNVYLHMLQTLCKERQLPDVDFFLNLRDFSILKKDFTEPYDAMYGDNHPLDPIEHPIESTKSIDKSSGSNGSIHMAPIFGYCGRQNYADIPMPTYEDWVDQVNVVFPDGCKKPTTELIVPWKKRIPKLVFRGSATGCGVSIETNIRLRATKLALESPLADYMDIGITNWKTRIHYRKGYPFVKLEPTSLPKNMQTLATKLSQWKQAQYKYHLYLDGHAAACRLGNMFKGGNLIMIPTSEHILWFTHLLKPWKHYVPVKADLSDMTEKLKWCLDNDTKCKRIAENALLFYQTYLSREHILRFWESALYRIASKKSQDIKINPSLKLTPPTVVLAYRDPGDNTRKLQLHRYLELALKFFPKTPIIIVEQSSQHKFNLGALKNIGFRQCNTQGIIFSDIDMFPDYNLLPFYTGEKVITGAISMATRGTRYQIKTVFKGGKPQKFKVFMGGIMAFERTVFEKINGYPSNYWGWGGEDDDLRLRCVYGGVTIGIPKKGTVIDLEEDDGLINAKTKTKKHLNEENKENKRWEKWQQVKATYKRMGLSSLKYEIHSEKTHKGIRHIKVILHHHDDNHANDRSMEDIRRDQLELKHEFI
uniref:Glycosyltransferase family 90 n=1 Tax=Megaviridae environmental sample TaxID=1737588 RepID=A0A5J6VKP2_9VIRU|nr:MAG: glycosyltransferase family 90 [Megaviridae environmental sample]